MNFETAFTAPELQEIISDRISSRTGVDLHIEFNGSRFVLGLSGKTYMLHELGERNRLYRFPFFGGVTGISRKISGKVLEISTEKKEKKMPECFAG